MAPYEYFLPFSSFLRVLSHITKAINHFLFLGYCTFKLELIVSKGLLEVHFQDHSHSLYNHTAGTHPSIMFFLSLKLLVGGWVGVPS